MENFFINIYLPVEGLNKGECDFYTRLYNYKAYCRKASNVKSYKSNDEYLQMRDALNKSYEKIKDLSFVEKNSDGEYDYPQVGYKKKIIGGKNHLCACILDEGLRRTIPIGEMFFYDVIYEGNTLKAYPNGQKYIETNVHSIIKSCMEKYKATKNKELLTKSIDICKWIDVFPPTSIFEVNFGDMIDEETFKIICDDVKDKY